VPQTCRLANMPSMNICSSEKQVVNDSSPVWYLLVWDQFW